MRHIPLASMNTGHLFFLYGERIFFGLQFSVWNQDTVYKSDSGNFLFPHPENKHSLTTQGRNELEDVGVQLACSYSI